MGAAPEAASSPEIELTGWWRAAEVALQILTGVGVVLALVVVAYVVLPPAVPAWLGRGSWWTALFAIPWVFLERAVSWRRRQAT